ncbi:UNKNOWN [Stylonychia lemnae]|uniref:Cyclin-like domain-containing protein n=1 Tax=Stylonychia lemnae TaxID=5949 RepID=A0A078ACW3_STYLE|nr:UNKNOWN [Stylonychia lemnae]|eukprot:CDW80095.1 UNKNOWN [Stylonychia lemnae]
MFQFKAKRATLISCSEKGPIPRLKKIYFQIIIYIHDSCFDVSINHEDITYGIMGFEHQPSKKDSRRKRQYRKRIEEPEQLIMKLNQKAKFTQKLKIQRRNQDIHDVTFFAIGGELKNKKRFDQEDVKVSESTLAESAFPSSQSGIQENIDGSQNSYQILNDSDYLLYHDFSEQNRAKLIDWMILVFKVLNKSVLKTFFLAIQILDRYFIRKQGNGQKARKQDLHITGLTAILVSSKFEDIVPIYMRQILVDAAHGKFTPDQIMTRERDILITLDYCFHRDTILEVSTILLKQVFISVNEPKLSKLEEDQIMSHTHFLLQMVAYSIIFLQHEIRYLSLAIIWLSLKYQKTQSANKNQNLNDKNNRSIFLLVDSIESNSPIKNAINVFKNEFIRHNQFEIRNIRFKIADLYSNFDGYFPGLKNIKRNYPQYF